MTYTIVIQPGARVTYQRLRQADRTQVRAVKKAIDALAADPRPAGVHRDTAVPMSTAWTPRRA